MCVLLRDVEEDRAERTDVMYHSQNISVLNL